jgi:casein kinase II subunit alpha
MVFQKAHLFKGNDNYDQLYQITKLLGSDDLFAYVKAYKIQL